MKDIGVKSVSVKMVHTREIIRINYTVTYKCKQNPTLDSTRDRDSGMTHGNATGVEISKKNPYGVQITQYLCSPVLHSTFSVDIKKLVINYIWVQELTVKLLINCFFRMQYSVFLWQYGCVMKLGLIVQDLLLNIFDLTNIMILLCD